MTGECDACRSEVDRRVSRGDEGEVETRDLLSGETAVVVEVVCPNDECRRDGVLWREVQRQRRLSEFGGVLTRPTDEAV
jgi:hypothetical protein